MKEAKVATRAAQRGRPLAPSERERQSSMLRARLRTLDALVGAADVALFAGIAHEPDMRGVFDDLAPRARWLPKVLGGGALAWAPIASWSELTPGCMSILEPAHAEHRGVEHIDVVLVPGVAFDGDGRRLGWGGGYYDRLLAAAPSVTRVGVCLQAGLLESVPAEEHDERMDLIVTPTRLIVPPSRHR